MMKRARVASDVSMILRGAGVPRVIPPGPCWVLEGPHWICLMWHEEDGQRHTAEISQRDYAGFIEQGFIQFANAPADGAGPALQEARRREQHTPVAALNSRW
jgi:hypothetical protein